MALSTGVYSPITQAKLNAWLALRNYSSERRPEAGTYLKQARENLEKVIASGSATVKEEAGKLSQEVAKLEKNLAGEEKVAVSALRATWEKSEALAERSAAYISAGLSEEETTLRVENNLIEARLHVAYAEIYQVTTAEPDKATKELDKAYSYLKKAARNSLAGPADRKKIRRIDSALLALKANLDKSDAVVHERYDTIKEELTDLIQKM